MAVLEKIRKRSVLLFVIIIGALLAFILGDFLNSGRSLFGPGDTVAKVGNVKVNQMDLNKQSELVEADYKNPEYRGQDAYMMLDPDYRYNKALELALKNNLEQQEYDRLGFDVTDDFITEYINNPNFSNDVASLLISQIGTNNEQVVNLLMTAGIVNPVTGGIDIPTYLNAINNPANYHLSGDQAEVLSQIWQKMENDLANNVKNYMYQTMLHSMLVPNLADAKADFEDENSIANVQMTRVNLSTVKDSDVKIEDADYQTEYNKNKDAYRILEEHRELAYITIPIEASQKDFENANKATAALKADLKTKSNVEALKEHKGFTQQNGIMTAKQLKETPLASLVSNDSTTLQEGMVEEVPVMDLVRMIAKVNNVTTGYDDVVFSIFPVKNQAEADSLFTNRTIEAIDSVITTQVYARYGSQAVQALPEFVNNKQTIVNPEDEKSALIDAIITSPLNQYVFVNDSTNANSNFVLVVKERGNSVPAYDISTFSYEIYPSEQTRQELTQQLHSYIANHPDAAKFAKDDKGVYDVKFALVNNNSFTIDQLSGTTPSTRGLVKWAMDADKGKVSPVFTRQMTTVNPMTGQQESQDYLIALAVVDVYDDYIPVTSQFVKNSLKDQVTKNKKAKKLIDQYKGKGKNAQEYANAMGTSVDKMFLSYNGANKMRIGGEAQGALAAAKKGDVVGPIQGRDAIYVFQVDDVNAGDFKAEDTKSRINATNMRFVIPVYGLRLLLGNRPVTNNTFKMMATPTE